MIQRLGLDMLIVDESTKFKNSATQRFKYIKTVLRKFKRRYILTGTPAPNGLLDLFGQIYILDEGNALGRFITHYRTTYFFPSGFGGYEWVPQKDAMDRITARIAPLTLRLRAKDYLELPELVEDDKMVTLPPEARAVYDAMEAEFIASINSGEVVAANSAVASGKCRQIANGALYTHLPKRGDFEIIHSEKLKALADLIEELSGQPLFILYEFDFERIIIHDSLKIPYFGKSEKLDSQLNDAFNGGGLKAVMGQPSSVAWGLNLQEACGHICWYGMTWNLEHYEQAIDRVLRQGNPNKRVIVHRIIAEDTIDEIVRNVLKGKDKTQQAFLNELKRLRS
jgi:SNF2 family DNA or RNA helicase